MEAIDPDALICFTLLSYTGHSTLFCYHLTENHHIHVAIATNSCNTCSKTTAELGTSLKRCAKCHTTPYCSRDCQKTDWKKHKKICAKNAAAPSSTRSSGSTNSDPGRSKGLSAAIDKPFHRLDNNTWLHDRPETDVFKLLIDAYRLRIDDENKYGEGLHRDGSYSGTQEDGTAFRKFLNKAHSKPGLLPSWWSPTTVDECITVSLPAGQWSSLTTKVGKGDIIEHYGDGEMPIQLRMLAEEVYGSGVGGANGKEIRKIMMMRETGELKSNALSRIDIAL